MIKFTASSVLCLALPLLAFGATQSDTVPTSQLTAAFQVAPQAAGDTQVEALVTLTQVLVSNGQESDVTLQQSTDDVVTFSVGQSTITYNPAVASANTLPFTPGATYTVSFKRFNGESYAAAVVMPDVSTVTAPTPQQVFKSTDVVNLAWSAVTAQDGLFVMTSNCEAINLNGLAYNATYTAAVIPAGAVSACTGDVQMAFTPIYINGGTGFGSVAAASIGGVQFSYGASAPQTSFSLRGVRVDRLLAQARLKGRPYLLVATPH